MNNEDKVISGISPQLDEVLSLLKEMRRVKLSNEEIQFIRQLIENKKAEKELILAIKSKVIGGTIWSIIVALTLSCIFAIKHWIIALSQ